MQITLKTLRTRKYHLFEITLSQTDRKTKKKKNGRGREGKFIFLKYFKRTFKITQTIAKLPSHDSNGHQDEELQRRTPPRPAAVKVMVSRMPGNFGISKLRELGSCGNFPTPTKVSNLYPVYFIQIFGRHEVRISTATN